LVDIKHLSCLTRTPAEGIQFNKLKRPISPLVPTIGPSQLIGTRRSACTYL
jgi:hypothetical protein